MNAMSIRSIRSLLTLPLATLFLSGCVSVPKVDWDSRVGNYTYNQALADLGQPTKTYSLGGGTQVAEWVSSSTAPVQPGTGLAARSHGYNDERFGPSGTTTHSLLRLTFGHDGRLEEWMRDFR